MNNAADIVGKVENPLPEAYRGITAAQGGGLILFLTNILRLVFVVAGLFAFINLILAGFQFMGAGGDAKAVEKAWAKIWQSLLGLILVAGSFALAALFGYLLFGDAGFILNPQIWGPE
jgi:nucleoside recognition membrane protein YjiH